ncbi:hypothetical protein [Endozoicomonas atrinae]|uniref:hypothetical protein n=1 Tax=Endozoicomonas atrinae TaxID=1333660 RepID=UPI000826FC9D|nr:hypothetical protein [Endozoicomonas atrinae]
MTQFDWKQIPRNRDGFVNYSLIPSMPVRRMIARAEVIKLTEDLKARRQWQPSDLNQRRIRLIEAHLLKLERAYPEVLVELS